MGDRERTVVPFGKCPKHSSFWPLKPFNAKIWTVTFSQAPWIWKWVISHRALQLCYLKLSPSNTKADTMSHCFLREKWYRAELWGPRKDGVTGGCSAELRCDNGYNGWEASRALRQASYRDSGLIAMVYVLNSLTETQGVVLCKVCTWDPYRRTTKMSSKNLNLF